MNARDLKTIYVAHFIGRNLNNKSEYTEPFRFKAVITDNSTRVQDEDLTRMKDYDLEIRASYGEMVKLTNENSILWVETTPNAKKDNFDYIIDKKPNFLRDGTIAIYCRSVETNTIVLYYCMNGTDIYCFNMQYDRQNQVAKVPRNTYLPFDETALIWSVKPTDTASTKGKLSIIKIERTQSATLVYLQKEDGNA